MKWPAAIGAMLLLIAGCRNPPPSWNLFAPYGPTRVPSPATGSNVQPNTYYQPPAQTTPPTGLRSELNSAKASPLASSTNASAVSSPVAGGAPVGQFVPDTEAAGIQEADSLPQDSAIRLASASRSLEDESPVRVLESKGKAGSARMELKGMPVNDATQAPSGGGARPQLAPLAGNDAIALPTAKPTATVPAARKTPSEGSIESSATDGASGWQTRPEARKPLSVAGR